MNRLVPIVLIVVVTVSVLFPFSFLFSASASGSTVPADWQDIVWSQEYTQSLLDVNIGLDSVYWPAGNVIVNLASEIETEPIIKSHLLVQGVESGDVVFNETVYSRDDGPDNFTAFRNVYAKYSHDGYIVGCIAVDFSSATVEAQAVYFQSDDPLSVGSWEFFELPVEPTHVAGRVCSADRLNGKVVVWQNTGAGAERTGAKIWFAEDPDDVSDFSVVKEFVDEYGDGNGNSEGQKNSKIMLTGWGGDDAACIVTTMRWDDSEEERHTVMRGYRSQGVNPCGPLAPNFEQQDTDNFGVGASATTGSHEQALFVGPSSNEVMRLYSLRDGGETELRAQYSDDRGASFADELVLKYDFIGQMNELRVFPIGESHWVAGFVQGGSDHSDGSFRVTYSANNGQSWEAPSVVFDPVHASTGSHAVAFDVGRKELVGFMSDGSTQFEYVSADVSDFTDLDVLFWNVKTIREFPSGYEAAGVGVATPRSGEMWGVAWGEYDDDENSPSVVLVETSFDMFDSSSQFVIHNAGDDGLVSDVALDKARESVSGLGLVGCVKTRDDGSSNRFIDLFWTNDGGSGWFVDGLDSSTETFGRRCDVHQRGGHAYADFLTYESRADTQAHHTIRSLSFVEFVETFSGAGQLGIDRLVTFSAQGGPERALHVHSIAGKHSVPFLADSFVRVRFCDSQQTGFAECLDPANWDTSLLAQSTNSMSRFTAGDSAIAALNQAVVVWGDNVEGELRWAFTNNFVQWSTVSDPILSVGEGSFDRVSVHAVSPDNLIGAAVTSDGDLWYFETRDAGSSWSVQLLASGVACDSAVNHNCVDVDYDVNREVAVVVWTTASGIELAVSSPLVPSQPVMDVGQLFVPGEPFDMIEPGESFFGIKFAPIAERHGTTVATVAALFGLAVIVGLTVLLFLWTRSAIITVLFGGLLGLVLAVIMGLLPMWVVVVLALGGGGILVLWLKGGGGSG